MTRPMTSYQLSPQEAALLLLRRRQLAARSQRTSSSASLEALTPERARAHLKNRILARASAVDYAAYIEVPGRPVDEEDPDCELFHPIETTLAAHHILLLEALEECARTYQGRLMVFMPPGGAKSTYGSVVFPSRYLGEHGGRKIIMGSHSFDLAKKQGRRVRAIVKQKRYERIYGCGLSPESRAADQFILTNGSEYMAAGILSGVTGNRADGLIFDDPIRNRAVAHSQTERDRVWEEYEHSFLTRLLPGGWVVLIMTRWHEDDPAGRILPPDWTGESGVFQGRDGLTWRVLCLQAICETNTDPMGRAIGESFWPEWFGTDGSHWKPFQRDRHLWASLYQQIPRPIEGSFFTEAMFLVDGRPIDTPQLVDSVFAVIDTAMKTGKRRDGTAVMFFARCMHRDITYPLTVLDWDLKQLDAAVLIDWLPAIFDRLEHWARETKARMGIKGIYIEDKVSGTVLIQQAKKLMVDRVRSGLPVVNVFPIDSKLSSMGKNERALNASHHIMGGDVKYAKPAYERTVEFHGTRKNHALAQATMFDPSEPDQGEDDLLDCKSYGVALALGNSKGF